MMRPGASGKSANRSSGARMSPCTNRTPARASRGRFSSAPRRCRLSKTMTRMSGRQCFRAIARVEPTKPAPPVISTQSYMVNVQPHFVLLGVVPPVIIAPGKVLFQPYIEHNEQIPATHLLNSQFRDTSLSIHPANGDHSESVATRNGLQRHLYREIEMRGDQRLQPLDYFPAVEFKGVREIVEGDAEQGPNEPVGQAVQDQLVEGVVNHSTTTHEPRAKDAVWPFQKLAVARHHVLGTI